MSNRTRTDSAVRYARPEVRVMSGLHGDKAPADYNLVDTGFRTRAKKLPLTIMMDTLRSRLARKKVADPRLRRVKREATRRNRNA